MIANLPPLHETKPHCTHPLSPTGRHRDDIGDATGTRAAGTSAPTTHRAMSAHARHVRTRTPCAHLVRHAVPGAPLPTGRHRGRPRVRGPPGTSAPTTHRAMSVNARYARTRTPCAHLVGRDVLGAPRPRDDIGDAHGHAGRRGRRPLPRSAPCPHTRATSAHARHARTWSGATSSARRAHGTSTGRHRGRPRGRGPPGTSAPTTHRAMSANAHARHVRTW